MTRTRRIVGVGLAVIVVLLTVIGLVDLMEGGLALLIALALTGATRVVTGLRAPGMLWAGLLTGVSMALTLVAAVTVFGDGRGDFANPAGAAHPLLQPALLNGVFRVVAAVALVGAVQYLLRIGRPLRGRGADARGALRSHDAAARGALRT